jgi:hypothetical protein
MRRANAILSILALLAAPLALLARTLDAAAECTSMCCYTHSGHHGQSQDSNAAGPASDMACHHAPVHKGPSCICLMHSHPPVADSGRIAPFGAAKPSALAWISGLGGSRHFSTPALQSLASGFARGPFDPPRS